MQQAAPVIHCPNLRCRTANPEGVRLCQECGTPLPHRYLWMVYGDTDDNESIEALLSRRYRRLGPQIVIDTQPGIPLAGAFDVTDDVIPYLKLFPYRIHLPQIYSLLMDEAHPSPLLLLEGAPLTQADLGDDFPEDAPWAGAELFVSAWRDAHPLRQVNWLWQMVQLWHPLSRESVASSLLDVSLLRTEGPLLRLRELRPDAAPMSLAALGEFWAKRCLPYVGDWRSQFSELCDRIIADEIQTLDPLLEVLESRLESLHNQYDVRVGIATRTDSGPVRDHNEDACYPHSGAVSQNRQDGLAIVCDGVGGHAGGEVASGIAIDTLTEYLKELPLPKLTPEGVMSELERSVSQANDLITQQNDKEERHDRDRMGTTVVMSVVQHHDLYITNLGDSRAYLITPYGCYQVTTDDDIASREVRLGYLPYREAQRQPGSGSLIQALGMVPSSMLRPAVHRFILDSDCLFLLCSDGLSDFERVENLWQDELLPLLKNETDLAEASKRLVAIANEYNGHDNVTVGLIHCRVRESGELEPVETPKVRAEPETKIQDASEEPPERSNALWVWLLAIGLLAVAGVGGVFALRNANQNPQPSPPVATESPQTTPEPSLSPDATPVALPVNWWEPGKYLKVERSPQLDDPATLQGQAPLTLLAEASAAASSVGVLKEGALLRVLQSIEVASGAENQDVENQEKERWVEVRACLPLVTSVKPGTGAVDSSLSETFAGYIQADVLADYISSLESDATQFQNCVGPADENPASSPIPTVTPELPVPPTP